MFLAEAWNFTSIMLPLFIGQKFFILISNPENDTCDFSRIIISVWEYVSRLTYRLVLDVGTNKDATDLDKAKGIPFLASPEC